MKVLKLGRPQNGYAVEVTCTGHGNGGGGCGALLLVDQDDLRLYPGVPGESWGSRDPAVMFRCCECGVLTDLSSKEEPPSTVTAQLKKATARWRNAKLGSEDADET